MVYNFIHPDPDSGVLGNKSFSCARYGKEKS